jgi:hypothetical protein
MAIRAVDLAARDLVDDTAQRVAVRYEVCDVALLVADVVELQHQWVS